MNRHLPSFALTVVASAFAMHCGGTADSNEKPAAVVPSAFQCDDSPAAPFAKRTSDARAAITSACGEIAFVDAARALHFVPVATGAVEDVTGSVYSASFTTKGDRLVAIDEAGAKATVFDTKTRQKRELTLASPGPKPSLAVLPNDTFVVCTEDRLHFYAMNDGHEIASADAAGRGCVSQVETPAVTSVTTYDFGGSSSDGKPTNVYVQRQDGARSTIALLAAKDPGISGSSTVQALVRGRFVAAFTRLEKSCGDTFCPTDAELVVIDGATGSELLRGKPEGGLSYGTNTLDQVGVREIESGVILPFEKRLVFLAADGTLTELGASRTVDALFDTKDGPRAVVHDPHASTTTATLVDLRTGADVASLGALDGIVTSFDGSAMAYVVHEPCIHYRTNPGVCHAQPVSVRVRTASGERTVGWNSNYAKVRWVGVDGSVVVGSALLDGAPPAVAEPEEVPQPTDTHAAFVDPSGKRTAIDLDAYSSTMEVTDLRGVPLVSAYSNGPDRYAPPNAAPKGTAFFRVSSGGIERLVSELDSPVVAPARRPAFGVVVGSPVRGDDGAPTQLEIYSGALR